MLLLQSTENENFGSVLIFYCYSYFRFVKTMPCIAVFMSSLTIVAIALDRYRVIVSSSGKQVILYISLIQLGNKQVILYKTLIQLGNKQVILYITLIQLGNKQVIVYITLIQLGNKRSPSLYFSA